jgi:hypothetical protein
MKTITLYHPHTHEGVAYTPPPEGIALTVNDADAALLIAWGLTTPPPTLDDAPVALSDANGTARDRDAIAHDDGDVVIDTEARDA